MGDPLSPSPPSPPSPALSLDAALEQASNELGLEEWYRDCVRPLLRDGPDSYPGCCGGGCDPCNQLLVRVAERTLELLEKDRLQ